MCQGPFHTHQTSSAVEVAMVRTTAKLFAAADRPYWAFRAARLKRHVLTDENECESPNTSTVGSSKSLSNFEKTSNPVKAVVSSLTNMFVWISGEFITDDLVQGADRDNPERSPLSVEELEAEIRQEYAKNYLWTGNINENLYEVRLNACICMVKDVSSGDHGQKNMESSPFLPIYLYVQRSHIHRYLLCIIACVRDFFLSFLFQMNCSFTDPTLSFSGIETYKRNIASLQGVLDALVSDSSSILNSCTLRQVGVVYFSNKT